MKKIKYFIPLPQDMTVVVHSKPSPGDEFHDFTESNIGLAYLLALVEENGKTEIRLFDNFDGGFADTAEGDANEYRVVRREWLKKNPPECAFGFEPRKMGEWVDREKRKATCSICGTRQTVQIVLGEICTQFCEHCHHPMKGKYDNGTKRWYKKFAEEENT